MMTLDDAHHCIRLTFCWEAATCLLYCRRLASLIPHAILLLCVWSFRHRPWPGIPCPLLCYLMLHEAVRDMSRPETNLVAGKEVTGLPLKTRQVNGSHCRARLLNLFCL